MTYLVCVQIVRKCVLLYIHNFNCHGISNEDYAAMSIISSINTRLTSMKLTM